MRDCQLFSVIRLLGVTPCKDLVTALIERWRPETNTFHLLQGEATISLEAYGASCEGVPVSVALDRRTPDVICEELLGAKPPTRGYHGDSVRISW
ncbi:Protein MAIN-LIKE 2 [Linum perenne]